MTITYQDFASVLDLLYKAGFEPYEDISVKLDSTGAMVTDKIVNTPEIKNGHFAMSLQLKNDTGDYRGRQKFHLVILGSMQKIILTPVMSSLGKYKSIKYHDNFDLEKFKRWVRVVTFDLKLAKDL
jgi:hypothetical protein